MNRNLLGWFLCLFCVPAVLAASGGTVNFKNRFTWDAGSIDAPVYDVDGTTRLAGAAYLAQLYAGSTPEQLVAAGAPVAFHTGFLAGYFSGSTVVLNVGPGETAYVQVRAWAAADGASYEDAVAVGGKAGVSGILTVVAGGWGVPPSFPANLVGLQSFALSQGPAFTKQPINLVVFVGQAARFEAAVSSLTPVSFQWQFNGVDIAGASGPTLDLPSVSLGQAGVYRLLASNATATVMSAGATLTVRPIPEGATVAFQNRLPGAGIDAPVFDADGVTRLAGAAFVAQLYAGASSENLAPVGDPVPFGTGADAGYWLAGDEFWRAVPGLAGGDKAYVQVRAWESAKGETYEAAKAAGGKTGESEILEVVTGGQGMPPGLPVVLTGLQSFRVGRLPVITEQPAGGWVQAGQSFVFAVQVSSEAPLTYQWLFNGSEIPGATQGRLELSSVGLAQAGSYQVVVSNFSGSVTSAAATLRPCGGTITFACQSAVAGIDAPVFDLDGTTKLAGDRYWVQLYAGPTAEELTPVGTPRPFLTGLMAGYWEGQEVVLPNVAPGQSAFAQVKAWDGASGSSYEQAWAANGKSGASALLQVEAGGVGIPPSMPAELVGLQSFHLEQGPVFIQQPSSLALFAGQSAVFAAGATSVTPISFQWQFNGADLAGATGPSLELPDVRVEQAGVYQLVARNATRPITSAAATLVVHPVPAGATLVFRNRVPEAGLDAPVFDTDGVTRLGGTEFVAQLYAGASPENLAPAGNPVPFGTGADAGYWLAGDEFWRAVPGLAGGDKAYVQVRAWESAKGETYEAAKAAGGKTGESEILEVVTGGGGTPPGLPVVLTGLQSFRVGRLPVITWQPAGGQVEEGRSFMFMVQVNSEAPVAYQWLFNGAELAGATMARLELTGVQPAQAGAYQVVVSNFSGSVTSAAANLSCVPTLPITSGGTVNFKNRFTWDAGSIDAPVYDVDGTTRLAGAAYLAQLYAGSTPEQLVAAGAPVAFHTGFLAGYFSGSTVVLNVGPGETAYVQVRAWAAADGASYEDAVAAGGKAGVSGILTVVAGGWGVPPSFPANLDGLQSFALGQGPAFTKQPINLVVFVGQAARFEAAVSSFTPVSLQWQFNGVDIAGASGPTLDLPSVSLGQAGVYRLLASNATATVMSAGATLTVHPIPEGATVVFQNRLPGAGIDAPVFDTDGVTRLAGAAFVAQLYAGASPENLAPVGDPVPFGTGADAGYWQMEDEFWRIIPGLAGGEQAYVQVKVWEWAKGESFEAAKAASGKVGESEILELVTGGAGTPPGLPGVLAGLQSFRVGRMPLITRQPVGGWVPAGQNFAFDVGASYAAAYQWLFNSAELAGAIGARLALTNVQPAQAGAYQVVVSNFVGSVTSATCWLQVSTLTSGGTIWFNNHVTSPLVEAPVYDVNGMTKLAGTNFLAQLWVGPSTNEMCAVGQPAPFSTGALAGYVAPGASARVAAPNVAPGALAFVQMRAWEANAGATYEDAVMAGGKCGASDIISVITGGLGDPPSSAAFLVNLRSFRLRQAPVIVAQTGDIIVDEGQQFYVEVTVDSGSLVAYVWQREAADGAWQNIAGATSFRLWLGAATKQMEGGYRVIARNQDGTTTGEPIHVYVSRSIFVGRSGWEDLRLELTGEGGPVYLVEMTTNLVDWVGLGLITNETAALEFSDPTAANRWARFYRAKSVQSGAVVSKAAAGFVVLEFPYGFSMRANPLLTGNDTVGSLLATGLPDTTTVYKFNGTTYDMSTFYVQGAESAWDYPDMALNPGQGFIMRNACVDTYYLAIAGQVPEGRLVNQIPVGWSIQASQVPQAGRLDTALGLPLVHGDNVDFYITELYDYEAHVTDGAGNWPIGGPPEVWLGESFWIYTTEARQWVREFSTKP